MSQTPPRPRCLRHRAWPLLLALAMPAAPAAADDDAAPTTLFNTLWSMRSLVNRSNRSMYVVEVLSPSKLVKVRGSKKLKLRAVADLGKDGKFQPRTFELAVAVAGNRRLTTDPTCKHYVALLYAYKRGNKTTWRIYPFPDRDSTTGGSSRIRGYYYLLGLTDPHETAVGAIRELMLGVGMKGPGERLERLLHYVTGDHKQARDFAASFAGVHTWQPSAKAPRQADDLARTILQVKDPGTRARLARVYASAQADLLPRDPALLEAICTHADPQVAGPALRDNLRHAGGRAKDLAGLLRKALTSPPGKSARREAILHGLGGWGRKALLLQAELRRLARGDTALSPTAGERLGALHVLLGAGADGAARLVRDTAAEVPSAAALQYAVDHDVFGVVPDVIQAARKGRLAFSPTHAAALSLLTRRFPEGNFAQFNRWWKGIEKAGRADAMVAGGFADPALKARADELIAQLGSRLHRERAEARSKLGKMGLAVLPSLRPATRHRDREIANAAMRLIEAAEARFAGCRARLAAAVEQERQTGAFVREVPADAAKAPRP